MWYDSEKANNVKYLFFFGLILVLGIVGIVGPTASFAQRYPDHPIQLVIPNPPGANMDVMARMLAEEMEKLLGAKIIPINKPGAATVLGTDAVVRAKKDGYTLVYTGASALLSPAEVRKLWDEEYKEIYGIAVKIGLRKS